MEVEELDVAVEELKDLEKSLSSLGRLRKSNTTNCFSRSESLIGAAKYGMSTLVNLLISCDVDVNLEKNGERAVDFAWENKHYGIVLSLLKADSMFPINFDVNLLTDSDEDFKNFLAQRKMFHEYIRQDNLSEIKKIVASNVKISKFYLNKKNQSSLFCALDYKKFDVFAYLKAVGVNFLNDQERDKYYNLTEGEKWALDEIMVKYFPPVSDERHIEFLVCKSRSQKPVPKSKDKLYNYYRELNQYEEISSILKIFQYSDYFDIIFDFDEEHVALVNPPCSKGVLGVTYSNERRLYVGAKDKNEVLMTTAHELTHMAMDILFHNDCKPYGKKDLKSPMDFITFQNKIKAAEGKSADPEWTIFLRGLKYPADKRDSELIARVPEVLTQGAKGREWLKKNIPELYDFFIKKVMPECDKFIAESYTIRGRSVIRTLNGTLGQISNLRSLQINFENTDIVDEMIKQAGKKILVFKTENLLLGTMKILQGLYGPDYISCFDEYLVLKFEDFAAEKLKVIRAFLLEGSEALVVQVAKEPDQKTFENCLGLIDELFQLKQNRKVILVTHPKIKGEILASIHKQTNLSPVCLEKTDNSISLRDLKQEYQDKILSKEIIFQGTKMQLLHLIGNEVSLYESITGDVIENLLQNKLVTIGGAAQGHGTLEGAFGQVYKKINMETFFSRFQNSNDIFVIKGLDGGNQKSQLMNYFQKYINEGLINGDLAANEIQSISADNFKIASKRLLVTDRFSDNDFKDFCQHYSLKKIHMIEFKKIKNQLTFELQEFYDPGFYLERKFKNIYIRGDQLKKLISESKSESFIITQENPQNYNFDKNYDKVKLLNLADAEDIFEKESGHKITHWFHINNANEIDWKKSLGSIKSIKTVYEHSKNTESAVKESNVIQDILSKKVILVADNPGMGKSTTLTKLCEYAHKSNEHWIVRINLKTHIEQIKKLDFKDFVLDHLIEFLALIKSDLKVKLTKKLLKSALGKKISKKVLFAFDGFDELLDKEDRDKIINLLKYLKEKTTSKIWITTRLHHKLKLEEALCTIALEFDPVDDENKKIFIKKYLNNRLKFILGRQLSKEIFDDNVQDSKLKTYTEEFLKKLKSIFTGDASAFIGTPLQLNLMMENSVEHFENWVENNNQNIDFSYMGENILTIYENFIERKYKMYFKKQNICEKSTQKSLRKYLECDHKALAEFQILKKNMSDLKFENEENEILLVGLVQSNDDQKEFVHFSFREYYFALVCVDKIMAGSPDMFEYFVNEILRQYGYLLIRKFINLSLGKQNFEKLPKEKFKNFEEKLILANNSIKGWRRDCSSGTEEIFWEAVKEGNGNIIRFLFATCESFFTPQKIFKILTSKTGATKYKDIFYQSALLNKDIETSKVIFKMIEKLERDQQKKIMFKRGKNRFYFRHSPHNNPVSTEVVKLLLKTTTELFSLEEQKTFLTEEDNRSETIFFYVAKDGQATIMNTFLEHMCNVLDPEEQKNYLMWKNKLSATVLHEAAISIQDCGDTVRSIFQKAAQILSLEERKKFLKIVDDTGTALHTAVSYGNAEVIRLILQEAENTYIGDELKKFITMECDTGTLLHAASKSDNAEAKEIIFQKAAEILSSEEQKDFLTKVDESLNTVLHLFTGESDDKIMNLILKQSEKLLPLEDQKKFLTQENVWEENVLHKAVSEYSDDIVSLILNTAAEILNPEEQVEFLTNLDWKSKSVLCKAASGSAKNFNILLQKIQEMLPPQELKSLLTKPGERYENVLHAAAASREPEIITILFEKAAKIFSPEEQKDFLTMLGENEGTVLHFAAELGTVKTLNIIFDKATEILPGEELKEFLKEVDSNNETVFHKAGHVEVMDFLIKKAAKILSPEEQKKLLTAVNSFSRTAIDKAIIADRFEVVEILLQKCREILAFEYPNFLKKIINDFWEPLRSRYVGWKIERTRYVLLKETYEILTDEELLEFRKYKFKGFHCSTS